MKTPCVCILKYIGEPEAIAGPIGAHCWKNLLLRKAGRGLHLGNDVRCNLGLLSLPFIHLTIPYLFIYYNELARKDKFCEEGRKGPCDEARATVAYPG